MQVNTRIHFYRHGIIFFMISILISCAIAEKPADPVTDLLQGQKGRIYFESTNPGSYREVMTDEVDKRKTIIWGTLTIPNSHGKVPAVIILSHAGGIQKKAEFLWAHELNQIGLATFVVDNVAPRKHHRYRDQRDQIHTPTFVVDAYNALNLLSTHPAIDSQRIAVIGYSKSGQAAHFAASSVIQSQLAKPGVKFAGHVGVYPVCSFTLHQIKMTGAPLLFLTGENDDKSLPVLCERYSTRIKKAGYKSNVIVYPGAYWGWDRRGFKRTIQSINTADCYVEFLDNGNLANPNTGHQLMGYEAEELMRKCLKTGYTASYDKNTTFKSIEDTKKFLSKVLLIR